MSSPFVEASINKKAMDLREPKAEKELNEGF